MCNTEKYVNFVIDKLGWR